MPGIVGIISRKFAPKEAQSLVQTMLDSMMHETFYVSGTQTFPELGIHAGWVAHADSLAANQVFWNERQDVALLFAGECFGGAQIRADLNRTGHDVGDRAGDWLVHLYEEKGEEFFKTLNGIFSGLLIDLRQQRGFLFNDRYGIERLYWYELGETTYFATEAKALLRVLPQLREFDPEGVTDFLTYGCTLAWRTLFKGIRLAPGGSLWTIGGNEIRKALYFTPGQWESLPPLTEEQFEEQLAEIFNRILPGYTGANAPVGISLTGGLDTRMIMASLPRSENRLVSYTFTGLNGPAELLDARIARQIAQAAGLPHELLRIGPDFFTNFATHADRTVYSTDGCFGVLGAHERYLNAQARQQASIRLTGNFGSEVLRSMSTFKPLGVSSALFAPDFALHLEAAAAEPVSTGQNPVAFAAFQEIPWSLFGSLIAGRTQLTFRTPYLDNELVALAFRAPPAVRKSPLPAVRFVQRASPILGAIPTDRGHAGGVSAQGRFLRRLISEITFKLDYHCSEGLPSGISVLDRPHRWCCAKMGVMGLHKYLHYRRWLQQELAPYLEEQITAVRSMRQPFWHPGFLETLASDHISGRSNRTREINAVLTLGAVERLMFKDDSRK